MNELPVAATLPRDLLPAVFGQPLDDVAHLHDEGEGVITTQLYFMPDVEVLCGACKGARFNSETLEVTVRGKTIDDVLNLSV